MKPDYVPESDAEFQVWQAEFLSYAAAHASALGLVAGDITPLSADQTAWSSGYTAHIAAHNAAKAAREAKDDARRKYTAGIRALVRRLQAGPTVTDAHKQALGIPVRDTVRTPAAPPSTAPIVSVSIAARYQHTVSFVDESTPTRRAKPKGVLGAEVWVKIGGAPPSGPEELAFLALVTATPYNAVYNDARVGQPAHYMLRWVNGTGEKGPWSATVSATIAG